MPEIEILGARQSIFVRVVWMTCEEKHAPYAIRPVMPHSPEIAGLHPFGRIPAMRHGDVVLFESKAIATYIDRSFDGPALIPDDPLGAARVEQWVSAINTAIAPLWTRYFQANVFPKGPGGTPDAAVIADLLGPMAGQVAVLDRAAAASPWLAGERFTLADIALLPILHYLRQFPEGQEMSAGAPDLEAYYGRLSARPSAQATVPPPMP